ncbi:MAG: hypothetical protein ACE5MB_02295, partial [Anaerolineae bacterium]
MRLMHLAKPLLLALTLFITSTTAIVFAQEGWDFVIGDLRVDLSEVYYARDYKVHLLADDKPSSGMDNDFTAAWLGVFLAQPNGQPGSGQFSQVGLKTDKNGIYWFVYAEPGVTCDRGSHPDPYHCYGAYGDLVTLGSWHQVELVTYGQGYWIARVYEANGTAHDVAKIWSNSDRIYLARSDTEEGYFETSDPYLTARFYHWHPQYMKWGVGWQEWPASSGSIANSIWTDAINGLDPCPSHYGADPYWTGDPRAWFAGTGGKWCDVDPLFPTVYTYLPDVQGNANRNSIITVRNNSGGDLHVQAAFYDSSGNIEAYPWNSNLPSEGIWIVNTSDEVDNFTGSAIAYASEDVAIVVENRTSTSAAAYDGISPSTAPAPDPGFGRTGTRLRALPVYKNYDDWNTSLYIQNAGPAPTNVFVNFYNASGTWRDTDYYTIQPNVSRELDQADDEGLGSSFFGSAEVYSSTQPVAAVVYAVNANGRERAYSAFDTNISVSGEDPLWVPLFYRGYYDIYSQIHVQNWGSGTDVSTWYQTQEDCLNVYWEDRYISERAIQTFTIPVAPLSSYGSALVRPYHYGIVRPLLGLVETDRTSPSQSVAYESISDQGATTLTYAPIVYKAYGGWNTGIQVQNAHRWLNAKVKLYFLDSNGYTIKTLVDWICPMGAQSVYL